MTRFNTPGYKALRAEFNLTFDSQDPFGSAMSWFFPVADQLWHFSAEEIPAEWGYGHGDGCKGPEDDDYMAIIITDLSESGLLTDDDLLAFGHVMHRYVNLCKLAGVDY